MKKIFTNKFSLLLLLVLAVPMMALIRKNKYQYKFQDPSLPIDTRVDDLVKQMTLEEKVNQMVNVAPAIPRLNIPAFDWWNEALHGVARANEFYKTTVYPQAIANAATFDKASVKLMGHYIGMEGRAINNESLKEGITAKYTALTYWSPNINIFRDPRWGRGQETYGEDPYLTAQLGGNFVHGLQGDDPKYLLAAACAKHFAVHSGPEPDRHKFDVDVSNHDLWDTYLPAFHHLVVDEKVAGVMCAYNAFRGQPCCGSDLLEMDILRKQWGFTGYLTSDCGAIDDISNARAHHTSPTAEDAAVTAVLHSTDVECIVGGAPLYKTLVQGVKDGKIAEKDIDASVKRLFEIRFRLGLFDAPQDVKYRAIPVTELESPAHHQLALKMARQSIVLLKNENHVLPLKRNLKKIAVIGPNADNDNVILGNYNGVPSRLVTALQGIKAKVGPATEVFYSKAIDYVDNSTHLKDIANVVKDADVIVYVGGISPRLEGEEMRVTKEGFAGGDRTSIMLPKVQTALMKELKATGKPVVFVMMAGSAVATPWESENIPAIVDAWYGGQDAGTAIADVLFGDYNPAGRLPVTFYKSDSDLPSFDDYSMNNRTYRYFNGTPLYGFGYGLSYSSFKYDMLSVPTTLDGGKSNVVSVKVTNTGKIDGDEVTELYITHLGAKFKVPVRALKGFDRNFIKAGQSKIVKFELKPEDLKVVDENGKADIIKGEVSISVGGSQPDAQTNASKKTVTKNVALI
jgi:beta-glucosidase